MALGGHGPLGRRGRLPVSADINVTSLMDIAFVLLIIFMITAPLMQGGVEVQLPRAAARPLSARQGLIVTVDQSGRVFVDREEMSAAEFRASIKAIVERRQPSGVYLRGDRRALFGAVMVIMAAMQEAGVNDVSIVIEDER